MKPVTTFAVAIFAIVALLHLVRFFMGWEVLIGGAAVPMWVSLVSVLVAGGMAFMLWQESREGTM